MTTTPSTSSCDQISDDFEVIEKSNESLYNISAETYLSLPEEISSLSNKSDLENAITSCRDKILSIPNDTEERKWLVRRLIELQIRLENFKNSNDTQNLVAQDEENKNKVLLGHHFSLQSFPKSTTHYYCDRCSGVIWNILHNWYLCSECDYKCHVRCLRHVCRVCAHVIITEKPVYIFEICPEAENGLANQNYRCAECLAHISLSESNIMGLGSIPFIGDLSVISGNNILESRLCDYTGKYYCSTCHWNSTAVIPARVVFNWDFKERNVSRASKQILKLMIKLPILKLEELNPVLFACVEELSNVKELRQQLMQIKKYLISCKSAIEDQLLWQSIDKIHFLENDDSYSLQDLLELHSGELLKYLNKIKDNFIKHIKIDCQVCNGKGFICEFCKDSNIIFPFEENVVSCTKCQTAYHFFCWIKYTKECTKCSRLKQRMMKNNIDSSNAMNS